ncbi:MAG: ACP S-malonyltransferase [Planctomycetota bacterium]
MTHPTAVLFCPGRGAYGREELGSIRRLEPRGEIAAALDAADEARRAEGRPAVRDLDAADRFRPGLHLDGENAAELIYFATLAHVARLRERYRILAVGGNSLGWYTALPAAGALDPLAGRTLVATMARLQKSVKGGQILTTTVDERWLTDPPLAVAVERALQGVGRDVSFCARSIRLGGHEVLAGTDEAVAALLERLPSVKIGSREFPIRLAGHGPFHTKLCEGIADAAEDALADLPVRRPECHLIDGFGSLHTPWSADPSGLLDYTLREQVVETFDFTAAVRTAMREFQPDVLLCAGPGTSLRAPVGHVVLREGWRGIADRDALFESGIVRTG